MKNLARHLWNHILTHQLANRAQNAFLLGNYLWPSYPKRLQLYYILKSPITPVAGLLDVAYSDPLWGRLKVEVIDWRYSEWEASHSAKFVTLADDAKTSASPSGVRMIDNTPPWMMSITAGKQIYKRRADFHWVGDFMHQVRKLLNFPEEWWRPSTTSD